MKLEEKVALVSKGFEGGTTFDFGSASPNEKVDFEFKYEGEIPIQAVKASCGCTNLRVEGNTIKGVLSIGAEGQYSGQHSTHFLDKEDRVWRIQNNIAIPTDPRLKPVPLAQLQGKRLPMENKTFTVFFDDGEELNAIDENKVIRENGNKTKITLAIRGFIKL